MTNVVDNGKKYSVGDEIICPLVIDNKVVKKYDNIIYTIGRIKSINNNNLVIEDIYKVFDDIYQVDKCLVQLVEDKVNRLAYYQKIVENSKKFITKPSYKFSHGSAAANLYYKKYTMTFDYAYDSLYFGKNSNLLNLSIKKLDISMIDSLYDKDKNIFKKMLKEMIKRTSNFTYYDIQKLLIKLRDFSNYIIYL